ncbi:MAG: alpha/beta hydrolase [Longimicrobiales bacterium]
MRLATVARPGFVPLSLVLLHAAPLPAQESAAASRVVEVEVPAPSLEHNRVGTPAVQGAAIYLPPGYGAAAGGRYPTIYMLHGIFDDYGVWLEYFDVPALLDRLIASRTIPPVIVVMPNGGNRYGGGFYRDSPVTGDWSGFVTNDLVTFVDAGFRTIPRAGGRAIIGHSMGGYGAIHLAMERPGVFAVAYAMSPCCLAPVDDLGFGNSSWIDARTLSDLAELERAIQRRDFYVVAAIGVLSAFAPDTLNPPFFVDFPFEVERGELVLDEAEYLAYLERFPIERVGERHIALRALRALALDYGTRDQFAHIPAATLAFSRRLGELRVPHRLEVYSGDHREQIRDRLERLVLPYATSFLDTEQSGARSRPR